MRFVLTSDLHGSLPKLPAGDVLIVAGDLCPIDNHAPEFQAQWLRRNFIPWLEAAPARHKLFIAGNHDFVFAHEPELLAGIEWPGIYLEDSGAVCAGVSFWGTPWATELAGWPFTAPEHDLAERWHLVPPQTQVLIVHGPPYGFGDEVIGSRSGDRLNTGSRTLTAEFYDRSALRLVVFGHIHEGVGLYRLDDLLLVNASLMDRDYQPVNPIRVLDLEL